MFFEFNMSKKLHLLTSLVLFCGNWAGAEVKKIEDFPSLFDRGGCLLKPSTEAEMEQMITDGEFIMPILQDSTDVFGKGVMVNCWVQFDLYDPESSEVIRASEAVHYPDREIERVRANEYQKQFTYGTLGLGGFSTSSTLGNSMRREWKANCEHLQDVFRNVFREGHGCSAEFKQHRFPEPVSVKK